MIPLPFWLKAFKPLPLKRLPFFSSASATMVAAFGKQVSCMPVAERQGRRHFSAVETAIVNEGVSLTILSGLVSRTCLSR